MKVLYLAAGYGDLGLPGVTYQDLVVPRDLGGDMLDVPFDSFDILVATPPCNYWSFATCESRYSQYAKDTMHLLPDILKRFIASGKPFIVENVKNSVRFKKAGLFDLPIFTCVIGRHTYFTSHIFSQDQVLPCEFIKFLSSKERQGAGKVNEVIRSYIQMF